MIRIGVIILFLTISLHAQNPRNYKIQKISVEKGLSHSVVTGITQDKLGFMWFSTLDGINRFDGSHFVNFYNQKENPFSLSNNFTQGILCDNQNEIWVATLDGLCKFDYLTERFTVFYKNPGDINSISDNEITCLFLSKAGGIWIGTSVKGLNYYDKNKKIFIRYNHDDNNINSLSSDRITALYEDDNFLWVGTFNGGVDRIDLKTKKYSHFKAEPGNLSALQSNRIRCIAKDSSNNIWIGSNKGLARYIKEKNNFQVFLNDPHNANSINGNTVMSIICDLDNNLWIGTDERGLNILNLETLKTPGHEVKFQHINMREDNDGLSIRSVYSIYLDKYKNIWIGTYSGGINFISSVSEKFQKYSHNPYDRNTINYPKVWGLCEDKNGNIWIGTDGGGIDRLNPTTNVIRHFEHKKSDPSSVSDNAILCAFRDHNNVLWFGTYAGGLNKYNESNETFKAYKPVAGDSNSIPVNDIRVIYEDKNKNLWIGTNGGGLCKYNPSTDNFMVINRWNSKISSNDIRALLDDGKGNLWIGTYSEGIDCYNFETKKFRNLKHRKSDIRSLSDNYVYALALDKNGFLWAGTGNGLSKFEPKTRTFVTFDKKNGLPNNFVHAILSHKDGNLWISTNKGISKYVLAENKFYNFDFYDGLQNGEFSDGSALLTQNGRMWFGGINGLNTFNPSDVSKSSFQPEVVLTGFQLFNNPVKARTNENHGSPLPSSISIAKSIELNYKQSVFTIDFVALNYSFPEKTQYAYKMEGYDIGWNDAGNKRAATYRELPAGKYVFEVKASNQDGTWSVNSKSIEIIIKPPFWKTWWAYCIYFIIIGSIIYFIIKYYKRQAELKNKLMLEQFSHQKDLELNQERSRFFTNISHEFRTPLTLILGPVEELLEKEKNTDLSRKFDLISRNARKLLDLINTLLDFRKVETGKMDMKVARDNIVAFTRDMVSSFSEMASHKQIILRFHSSEDEIEAWFDHEKFEMIYNNLLSNAFKFTPSGGIIEVDIRWRKPQYISGNSDVIAIIVKDNGVGIEEKHIEFIFDSYYSVEHSEGTKGTGIGLALTKSLVEMHGGKIIVESTIKQGSCFIIEIPSGNSHFKPTEITDLKESRQPIKREIIAEDQDDSEDFLSDSEQLINKKIMLIVEDNNDVRNYIADSFSDNYTILKALNGIEGYNLACRHIPDIIISDVMMPEMDGIEFCNKIKTTLATCHIPVIILTARTSITHKKEGYETGADSYVTKPFSVDLLKTQVESLLKSRKQLKEYYSRAMLLQLPTSTSETPDDKFIKGIIGLVEKYMADPNFDISKLASEMNMSRPVLYRKVRALTDLSVIEFIRTVRMNKAAQLLKTGQYRVSDVAFEVGFSDPKYFRKCFKAQFNIAPSEIMRNSD